MKLDKRITFIIALIFAAIIIVIIFFSATRDGLHFEDLKKDCSENSDCVPAECCHATACVPKSNAPNCSDIFCTLECQPGTLDCGQKECKCNNGNCEAVDVVV